LLSAAKLWSGAEIAHKVSSTGNLEKTAQNVKGVVYFAENKVHWNYSTNIHYAAGWAKVKHFEPTRFNVLQLTFEKDPYL
jgi:hypothetical protein